MTSQSEQALPDLSHSTSRPATASRRTGFEARRSKLSARKASHWNPDYELVPRLCCSRISDCTAPTLVRSRRFCIRWRQVRWSTGGCRPRQRPVRAGPAPRRNNAKLGHRLETGAPIGSFHGRDLFAPVAAMLARGEPPPGRPRKDDADRQAGWPDDLGEIVYVDHFGNAMTGLRVAQLPSAARLAVAGRILERARTFSDRQPGTAFWYENSNGLAEIAVNQGRADRELGLSIGVPVEIVS